MKICLSADSYPTPDYPFSAFISSLAEKFTEKGHQVCVIAPQSITAAFVHRTPLLPYHTSHTVTGGVVEVYRPKCLTFGNRPITLTLTARAFRKCFRRMSRRKFDIVYAHMWASGYRAMSCAEAENIPLFVASGEDVIDVTVYISEVETARLREAVRGVICVSRKNERESIRLGLADAGKCIMLPNGVDSRRFVHIPKHDARRRLGFSDEDFIVAFVGRFNNRKGAKRVAEALSLLDDRSIKSVFIGSTTRDEDSSEEPKCDGILFKGLLEHDEVALYLSASDVYVLPTQAEGCSNSIVEALSCGLPVISSDRDFNYDILDESCSILTDPLDTAAIASAIRTLREDAVRLSEMSANALAKAKELDYDTRIERILEFIRSRIN